MQFQDDLAAGVVLVRPALQSPAYDPGVSGWAVKIDGSAEFNDVVIRGTLESSNYDPGVSGWKLDQAGSAEFNDVTIRGATVTQGTSLLYNGAPAAGNLAISISPTAGTDAFGNAYPRGIRTRLETGAHDYTLLDYAGNIAMGSDAWDNDAGFFVNSGGLNWNTPYDNTGTQDDPITFHAQPGDSDGSPRGLVDVGAFLNGQDIDFQVYGTVLASPVTTASIPFLANASTGHAAALMDLRVNGSSRFSVNAAGDVTAHNLESGVSQTPSPGGAPGQTSVNVSFGKTFSATPRIVVTPDSTAANLNTSNIRWAVTNRSTTGFTINCWRDTNAATNFCWFATVD